MESKPLIEATKQLSKLLQVGYVDMTSFADDIVSAEDRDFTSHFLFNVANRTISFPSSSPLIEPTVLTVEQVRDLLKNPEQTKEYDECISTILIETGQLKT